MSPMGFSNELGLEGELHREIAGRGLPLLLLHGFGGTHSDFEHLLELTRWSERYQLIAPDLRGHGRSSPLTSPLTQRACAEDVLRLLDQLSIERIAAIGVSMGGNTLLHVAKRAPERVSSMILVSATSHFPEQARVVMRAAGSASHDEAEWAAMRARHLGGDAQIRALFAQPLAFAANYDDMSFGPGELREIRTRTLLVVGERDPLYPLDVSLELWRGIPDARLWVVPGAGHTPVFAENRPEFERIAWNFLGADETATERE